MSRKKLYFISFVQFICGLIFAGDVVQEAIAAANDTDSRPMFWHIIIETTATVLLAIGAYFTFSQMRKLQTTADAGRDALKCLRSEFDNVLRKKFLTWHLSKSESDVALLAIRGLSIHEIADTRKTKDGTIKAQLSTIFRKAGVSSRTELLALFMDELLDFSATA